jgi:hypothetical protein
VGQEDGKGPYGNGCNDPKRVKKHRERFVGSRVHRVRRMNHVGCIGVVGAFVALGAYIRMTPINVHRRKVMVDAGYWLVPMTLEASYLCSDGMIVAALLWVAILALLQFKDLDSVV